MKATAAVAQLPDVDQRLSTRLDDVARQVEKGLSGPTELLRIAAVKQGEETIAEVLEYVAGDAAAKLGLTGPIYPIALRWVDYLSDDLDLAKVGLVVPSLTEYYGARASVIRLRLPDDGVWGFPVIAHEYGHLVATQLSHRAMGADGLPHTTLVEDRLREPAQAAGSMRPFLLGHELFADLFATFVCGPAYPAYCMRYRFAPAGEPDRGHPQSRRRIGEMLELLHAMPTLDEDKRDIGGAELSELWATICAAAGTGVEPPDDGVDDLAAELRELVLGDSTLARVRYTGRDHVASGAAADRLGAGQVPQQSIAVIVAAAWRWRLQREATNLPTKSLEREVGEVETRALTAMAQAPR